MRRPAPTHIETNRHALLTIVMALVAVMRGVVSREVRLQVLRVLRPAEAAVRRLVVMAAQGLVLKQTVSRPMSPGLSRQLRQSRRMRVRRAVFQLADPFPPMVQPIRRKYFKHGPRISVVLPADPTVTAIFATQAPKVMSAAPVVTDPNVALMLRLDAIQHALADLPRQAQRLLRWKARRAAIALKRPIITSPMRPGRAPYLPRVLARDIDFVLERCHLLARDLSRTDSS
jgi:hypothetical protein